MNKVESLRHSFLFSCLNEESLPKIAGLSYFKKFPKGIAIFQEGANALGFFIVTKGAVKIYKLSPSGDEHILHVITDGGSFAEATVFGRLNRYPAYAEALRDTEALFISKHDFLALIRSDFSLALSVLDSMSEKLRYFNDLVEELSLKSAEARLAKYLLDLALKKKNDTFLLDIKKVELAGKLGIVPETLSRILKKFMKKHLLSVSRQEIKIRRKDKLAAVSSGEKI